MNKRIAMSAMSIFSALAIAGGTTFAFFSDTATSTGNTFATGTFDLQMKDADETTAADTVTASFNGTNMAPGGTPVNATIKLVNNGVIPGHHVHLKAANTVTDNGDVEALGLMQSKLEITSMVFNGGSIIGAVPETNGNGYKDLEDLQAAAEGMLLGSLADVGVDHQLDMSVRLHPSADNTYIGDSVSTVFTATLHQDASQ